MHTCCICLSIGWINRISQCCWICTWSSSTVIPKAKYGDVDTKLISHNLLKKFRCTDFQPWWCSRMARFWMVVNVKVPYQSQSCGSIWPSGKWETSSIVTCWAPKFFNPSGELWGLHFVLPQSLVSFVYIISAVTIRSFHYLLNVDTPARARVSACFKRETSLPRTGRFRCWQQSTIVTAEPRKVLLHACCCH